MSAETTTVQTSTSDGIVLTEAAEAKGAPLSRDEALALASAIPMGPAAAAARTAHEELVASLSEGTGGISKSQQRGIWDPDGVLELALADGKNAPGVLTLRIAPGLSTRS